MLYMKEWEDGVWALKELVQDITVQIHAVQSDVQYKNSLGQ